MRTIPLTQGKVALVDDADYEQLYRNKWCATKGHSTWYAMRHSPTQDGKRTSILMHREILQTPLGLETDHKDGHGLNNLRENLRVATTAQNARNQKKREGTTSHCKGVSWERRVAQWRADIKVNNRPIFLGRFFSEIEAARAYDRAAKKYFGEFACTNF